MLAKIIKFKTERIKLNSTLNTNCQLSDHNWNQVHSLSSLLYHLLFQYFMQAHELKKVLQYKRFEIGRMTSKP